MIEFVVRKLQFLLFMPEDEVARMGEEGKNLYFLAKGDCDVFINNEFKLEVYVATLKPGNLFGEVALLTHGKRTATVRCKNYCTIGGLTQE
jgi:CRP-like cAMP-binding protein